MLYGDFIRRVAEEARSFQRGLMPDLSIETDNASFLFLRMGHVTLTPHVSREGEGTLEMRTEVSTQTLSESQADYDLMWMLSALVESDYENTRIEISLDA